MTKAIISQRAAGAASAAPRLNGAFRCDMVARGGAVVALQHRAPDGDMDQTRAVVRAAKNVLFREIGGESVLLDLSNGSYFGLNEVGTRIWQLLSSGATLDATVAALVSEYEAPEERLRADLVALVEELTASGLAVVEQP